MLAKIADIVYKILGWKVVGELPKVDKYMIIMAPHTSNWDFVFFLLLKMKFDLKVRFIGKFSLFVGPLGWFLRKLGGEPVNQKKNQNVVDSVVNMFNENDKMIFVLSPEGTRSYRDHWKSGFYHIAIKAKVPINMAYLDAPTKEIGFGPTIELSGDQQKDIKNIADFYKDKKGFRPDLACDICLK
ncbi:MAG: lysophospholipid acyltransferase family protein [Gammaproteobacteria bacterium]|nr:lysophospholipid acyltransferase family protein [Gammaproteobacteria bacterium]